ncbi:MAG: dockerin type I repeat-containing protein [Euryarchaeota archaeon]|nr:dockerin type I repeat-containing protein [Euryarchaeota archaeon]
MTAIITEVIQTNIEIKQLVFGFFVALVVLSAPIGGAYAEDVTYRGIVVTGFPDFDGAVGAGGANVQIDGILSDSAGNLEIGDYVTATWYMVPPFADIDVALGDSVEICGRYRDITEMPEHWSNVGEHWTDLNTLENYLVELDVRFSGTAIESIEASMPGAPSGWVVQVDEVFSGPQPCSDQLNVTTAAVAPPVGYMDPDIAEGDQVSVYGRYTEQDGCGVSLIGSEDYYLRRSVQPMEGDVNGDGHVTIGDAMLIAQYTTHIITLDADQLKCADTTDEGSVTIGDAMHIAQYTVDPTGSLGVLFKPLWESPADDDMLKPVE